MSEGLGEAGRPLRCRQCQEPLESPIGCLHCHTIFPPSSGLTHFDRLGLPQRYDVDLKDLDRRYLAWSRELHPDYFETSGAAERTLSLTLSASLNDAYATLRDPFRRAEYLLRLLGGPSASEHRAMPPGFLEDVLDLRASIEAAAQEGPAGRPKLDEVRRRVEEARAESMAEAAAAFQKIADRAASGPPNQADLKSVRELLNTVKYYDGLLRETAPRD